MFSTPKTRFWSRDLPKTDNTYCTTSKYYGCTLAPGIPLIPNMCRRPLRSPGSGDYEYTFQSFSKTFSDEVTSNAHNKWIEKNNIINNNLDNGNSTNHIGMTKLHRRKVDFQDSGLDSDSDLDESQYLSSHSQNTVTWLSWIITVVTTVVTVVTETITGRQHNENHLNTRVPLKQNGGVSWYQYPVLWLYKAALLVHRADLWVLYKVNSVLRVDSWGTSQQRRRWALIILLIPLILWAGYKLWEWLWAENDPSAESAPLLAWIIGPLYSVWDWVSTTFFAVCSWFDGTWLWAPWAVLAGWWGEPTEKISIDEDSAEQLSDLDWSGVFSVPLNSATAFFVSLGGGIGSAASALGDGAVTVFSTIGSFLAAVFAWIVDCIYSVPNLMSSALALVAYPFTSMSWGSSTPVDYTPSAPPASAAYYTRRASPDSASLENLLSDKQLLALLVRNLLSSEEFDRAMSERQYTNRDQVKTAVDSAFNVALSKINLEFDKVKEEINEKVSSEESSVETKVEALKQQIHDLQMALKAHKALVSEQAVLGNRLESRVTTTEQLQLQENEEQEKLKQLILLEVAKVRDELSGQLMKMQLTQNMVVDSRDTQAITVTSELEAFVNSTVEKLLAIYDADKIAKVDYALASSGGSVLNVRCTETFSKKNAQYYMWGYPLWSKAANDPRITLEPGINAGECWAFTGSRGYLVIELSENITVTAFTMEHLPRSLSPSGTIDTAPKEFRVLGLESEQDEAPILLGRFKYEDNGVSLQHFQALEVDHSFKTVELVIESNHGNLEYTCLYRFRVHGRPVRPS